MNKEKYYKVKVFCRNCDFEGETQIPLGVSIDKHKCPGCGCQTLHKKFEVNNKK